MNENVAPVSDVVSFRDCCTKQAFKTPSEYVYECANKAQFHVIVVFWVRNFNRMSIYVEFEGGG